MFSVVIIVYEFCVFVVSSCMGSPFSRQGAMIVWAPLWPHEASPQEIPVHAAVWIPWVQQDGLG